VVVVVGVGFAVVVVVGEDGFVVVVVGVGFAVVVVVGEVGFVVVVVGVLDEPPADAVEVVVVALPLCGLVWPAEPVAPDGPWLPEIGAVAKVVDVVEVVDDVGGNVVPVVLGAEVVTFEAVLWGLVWCRPTAVATDMPATTVVVAIAVPAAPTKCSTRTRPSDDRSPRIDNGPPSRRSRPIDISRNALTITGSKCVPAQAASSVRAASAVIAVLYDRAAVMVS
jgi:hypothetical protein